MNNNVDNAPLNGGKSGGALPTRTANMIFLILTLLLVLTTGFNIPFIPKAWGTVIAYIPAIIVAIVMCKKKDTTFTKAFAFKGAKPLSFLLIFVIAIVGYPLVRVISEVTSMIFPSLMSQISGGIMSDGVAVVIISTLVIPVFFEEFFLRGNLLNSYNSTGRYRLSIIITAILFGMIHTNISQFFYAFVLGIIIGIVFTLTGSIFSGMIIHFVNNGLAILLSYINDMVGEEYMNEHLSFLRFDFSSTTNTIVTIICAVVGLAVICLCIYAIAKTEGQLDKLSRIIKGGYEGEKEKIMSPTMIIAIIVLCLVTVFVSFVVPLYYSNMGS